jgi:23S rRNA (uracil1939-C5)-methyltransferase
VTFNKSESLQERVIALCPHFGTCGGCQLQDVPYSAQLEHKQEVLTGLLAEAEIPEIKVESAGPWGYRNRIRLRVERVDGELRLGYSRAASNEFVAVTECPIAAPVLWQAASAMLRLSAEVPLVARWLAMTSEVELFALGDESKLQMQFFLRDAASARRDGHHFATVSERIQAAVPQLVGAGAELDPDLNRTARRSWDGTAWGVAGLQYRVAGRTYWVPRGAFFQVNRFLVDSLVQQVTDGRASRLAWDLFAGVGLFSQALAETFSQVVAVEVADPAGASLGALARSRPEIEAVQATTLDFLRARKLQRERPGLIVLDPPRAGIGVEAAEILAGLGVPEIVYVSCDPTTLARDLEVLGRSYSVEAVTLFDLFPQTSHIETVVQLRRISGENA